MSDKLKRYPVLPGGPPIWCDGRDVAKLEAENKSLREAVGVIGDRLQLWVDGSTGLMADGSTNVVDSETKAVLQLAEALRSREASDEPNTATHPAKEADKQP